MEDGGAPLQESIDPTEEFMASGAADAAGTASEAAGPVAADNQGGKDNFYADKWPKMMKLHCHNIETAHTDISVSPPTIEPAKDGEFSFDVGCHIY